jgi:hypothetical protein
MIEHRHDWRFDGDDPYIVCACGERRNVLTGQIPGDNRWTDLFERIEEIKVARLRPGDVIVAKTATDLEPEENAVIRRKVERLFPGHEVVITTGLDLEIVRPRGSAVISKLTLEQVLWECFRHFAHMDEANAAFHTAMVKHSPITFRLAEHLEPLMDGDFLAPQNRDLLWTVLAHSGAYDEDPGR